MKAGASLECPLALEILRVVSARRGLDFRDYRRETVADAIQARMAACGADGAAYLKRLEADADEPRRLAESILVPHTTFFRDPEVFEALRERVLPRLAASLRPGEALRAWAVGAASGEEAWTLAIALAEALGAPERFEVLGTDVNGGGLEHARAGRYPRERLVGLPAGRLARWFREAGDGRLEVAPELKARVRFARHDLLGHALAPEDAVLAGFHVVSCRNVLIWFDGRLRARAVQRLRAVVREGGALILGLAEALPDDAAGFEPFPGLAAALRVYRRCEEG